MSLMVSIQPNPAFRNSDKWGPRNGFGCMLTHQRHNFSSNLRTAINIWLVSKLIPTSIFEQSTSAWESIQVHNRTKQSFVLAERL